MTGWLTPIRDQPSSERERRTATTAVLAGIIAAVLLLAVTSGEPSAPAATHPSSTATPAVHPDPAQTPDLGERSVRVAHRFLAGYLAYAYGRAPAASVPDAARALIASLERHPPRLTIARQARLPRIEQLVVTLAQSGQPTVNAVLNDGGIVNYTVELVLARLHGQLIVTTLEPAR